MRSHIPKEPPRVCGQGQKSTIFICYRGDRASPIGLRRSEKRVPRARPVLVLVLAPKPDGRALAVRSLISASRRERPPRSSPGSLALGGASRARVEAFTGPGACPLYRTRVRVRVLAASGPPPRTLPSPSSEGHSKPRSSYPRPAMALDLNLYLDLGLGWGVHGRGTARLFDPLPLI
jgi:hypothetical protein